MNHETTEFAAQRFAPRQARDYSYFIPGRTFNDAHEWRVWVWLRNAACLACAFAIGAMLAQGV